MVRFGKLGFKITLKALPSDPLQCEFCKKSFSSLGNLNKHIRVVHKKCLLCDLEFPTSESLSEHISAQHSKKKNCPKFFKVSKMSANCKRQKGPQ